MNPAIEQAIEALEDACKSYAIHGENPPDLYAQSLSALRSIPRATEEEIYTLYGWTERNEIAAFKDAERFHFGEEK